MIAEGILKSVIKVLAVSWWFVIPLALAFIFWDFWLYYIRRRFIIAIKWNLLEIKIPRGIEKTPKAMEQVFSALRGSFSYGFTFKQKYWQGAVEHWFSFEMVGYAGGVYFYIRTPESHRNLVESAIYSQYPDAEIKEAEDYIDLIGTTLPNKALDLWGTDFILAREDAYPLRTYPAFEEKSPEAQLDPVAIIAEVMSRMKENEMVLIQILIRPTGDEWVKKGIELRDALIKREKPKKRSFTGDVIAEVGEVIRNLFVAPLEPPAWGTPEKKEEKRDILLSMTPGEKEIVEGIEHKISKLAFETCIRFVFVDDRAKFTRAHVSGVMGAFHQFNTHNLNSLRPNKPSLTVVSKGLFKQRRAYLKKRRLFDNYRLRRMPQKVSILNVEELATMFHIPTIVVEAPMLRHVPAKKGEPPAGLPIE